MLGILAYLRATFCAGGGERGGERGRERESIPPPSLHIPSISPSLHLSVPNLTTLVLTNNNIAELGDLEPLKDVKGLQYLSLLGNPVRDKKWYREWLAWRIPSLRVLDFQRIRDKVRNVAFRLALCMKN